MNNAIYNFREPKNEPVFSYKTGSPERKLLEEELEIQSNKIIDIPLIIGGKEVRTGKTGKVVMPSDHNHVLATYHMATEKEVTNAIRAALDAKSEWMNLSWMERGAIMAKAAELISKKHRYKINAATMLGQSKNVYQAEIDAACEVIDYLRFNTYFASLIYREQPKSENENINRLEYRPLEGFVYTVTPFNFTAIASNLNTSVALMGNTTVWKPASTSLLSNYYLMKIFEEAGLPPGVINFIPGSGALISSIVLKHRDLAGIHFTGSNATFNTLWKQVSDNLEVYKSYPRIVGETGGKDFIFAHNSANPPDLATAIVRGSFEYQGQKCSAASRAYIPRSLWKETLRLCDETSPYALTGAIFSNDKYAMITACRALRYAAGNFYINDKPTGAMVGQQPFGGSRASGTNDKAGSHLNLIRWVSPRTIKETLIPETGIKYAFME